MWKARTKDNKEVSELNTKWNEIQDNIDELLLITPKGQIIYLPKKMKKYVQFKTAGAELGKNNVEIESRVIGFEINGTTVKIRANEKTGNINIEVE